MACYFSYGSGLCTQRLCSPTAVGGACSRSWSLHPCGVDVPAATSPAATRLWQGATGATSVSFPVTAFVSVTVFSVSISASPVSQAVNLCCCTQKMVNDVDVDGVLLTVLSPPDMFFGKNGSVSAM